MTKPSAGPPDPAFPCGARYFHGSFLNLPAIRPNRRYNDGFPLSGSTSLNLTRRYGTTVMELIVEASTSLVSNAASKGSNRVTGGAF